MSVPPDGSGFPRGPPPPSHSIAINLIISEIKEVCFDLEHFFLKKFTLCNWLTVWEEMIFSAYTIEKSIPDGLKNYIPKKKKTINSWKKICLNMDKESFSE